jgi:hypothetical protein
MCVFLPKPCAFCSLCVCVIMSCTYVFSWIIPTRFVGTPMHTSGKLYNVNHRPNHVLESSFMRRLHRRTQHFMASSGDYQIHSKSKACPLHIFPHVSHRLGNAKTPPGTRQNVFDPRTTKYQFIDKRVSKEIIVQQSQTGVNILQLRISPRH